jgi:hypothetical protein
MGEDERGPLTVFIEPLPTGRGFFGSGGFFLIPHKVSGVLGQTLERAGRRARP